MKGRQATVEPQAMERSGSRRDSRPHEPALSGVEGSSWRRSLGGLIGRALTVFWSALREIFDESAYARFLERNRVESSHHAYAEFLHESQRLRERRPRCC